MHVTSHTAIKRENYVISASLTLQTNVFSSEVGTDNPSALCRHNPFVCDGSTQENILLGEHWC